MNAATALVGLALSLPTAGNDNNVEWNGISHVSWLDRLPICPVGGEAFEISFQTYRYDITSARVSVDDGTQAWVNAYWSHNRGPYDVWKVNIPSTASNTLSYYIELTDGTDTDYLNAGGVTENDPAGGGWVLDYSTVSHAPLGATVTSSGVAFKVWGADASSATLRGEFNGWGETAMNTDGNYWWYHFPGAADLDNYKFYFADRSPSYDPWQRDARFRTYNPNDNNNSMVFDSTTYAWGDQHYTPPPFEEMVIYELHVGTFSGLNDGLGNRMGRFRDVVDAHLDHLLYLGVNMVELMPSSEFDGFNSWGYNPTNVWGVEESYAETPQTGPDDLKYMIDRLHQAGIGVILDIVYNHVSIGGNYLWCYDGFQIYFDGDCSTGFVDTPWGAQANFDRFEVADYYADNVLYWTDEYHIDGFRMDATRYMRNNFIFPAGQPSGWSLMQRINDAIDRRALDKISIAEELPNDTAITNGTGAGGAGFDSQWHDAFADNVRQEIFDAAFGDPEMTKVRDAINDFAYPSKTDLVRYVEGHDEAGNEDRLAVLIDGGDHYSVFVKGRSKLAQGLTILTPGIPMFLMGGEWLEDIKFNSAFANRIDWAKAAARPEMILFFRDVINARKSNCGMRSDAPHNVYLTDDSNNVIAFWRGDGQEIVVVANFDNDDHFNYPMTFPKGGTWYEILNSQALDYLGNGQGNGGSVTTSGSPPYSASITVPQMGLLVFRHEDPLGRNGDLNFDAHVDLYDYYLFQQRLGDRGCGMSADLNEDGTVTLDDYVDLAQGITGP